MLKEVFAPLLKVVRLDGVSLLALAVLLEPADTCCWTKTRRRGCMNPSSWPGGFSVGQWWFWVHDASDKIRRRILSSQGLNPLSQSIMRASDKTDTARVAAQTYHAILKWDTQEGASSISRDIFCCYSPVTLLALTLSQEHQLKHLRVVYMRPC